MLTHSKIKNAQAGPAQYKLADAHRLYLLVTPSGGKLWRMNYTYAGQHRTLALGKYPLVSLSEARDKRDEARKLLDEGRDPTVAKRLKVEVQQQVHRNTFEKVARDWHEMNKPQWAARHADDVMRSLERDAFPNLGKLPITELTPPIVLKALRLVETRGAIETAKRARQRVSAVCVYAIAEGIAESDPAAKLGAVLKPVRKRKGQAAITDIELLRQMMNDAEKGFARPVTHLALRLLALTVVRPGELRGAKWEEFEDLDSKKPMWRIPASRMKGDLDRKEEEGGDHLVPLARQSVDVLRVLRPLTGNGALLFPSNRYLHKPISENAIGYLLNRSGYHGRHVPHGFRAAFSTIMNEWANLEGEAGDRAIIDLMLAHIPPGSVEGAYNRAAYMPRRRQLAQIWADRLTKSLIPLGELVAMQSKASPPEPLPAKE